MKKNLYICKGVLLGTLIVVFLTACGRETAHFVDAETETESTEELSSEATNTEEPQSEMQKQESAKLLYVYVCGEIKNPGVYTLPEGSRVCDLFEIAGGLTKNAAMEYWNQARPLVDGEMLYVPNREEVKDLPKQETQTGNAGQDTDKTGKVNINTASKEVLMTLPGIGEAKAMAILLYRQEHGAFSSIEELMQVEGIKEAVFSKVKDYIEI